MITDFKFTKKGILIDFYSSKNTSTVPGDFIPKPYKFKKKHRIVRMLFRNIHSLDIVINNLQSFRDSSLYQAGVASGKKQFDAFMKLAMEELKKQKPEVKEEISNSAGSQTNDESVA